MVENIANSHNSLNDSLSNNFVFSCSRTPNATYRTVSVNLPGFTIPPVDIINPHGSEFQPGNVWNQDDFVISFIVDENWIAFFEILGWMIEGKERDEEEIVDNVIETVSVSILDNHGKKTVASISYSGAFPTAVNSITLETNSGKPNVNVATVVFKWVGLEIEVAKEDGSLVKYGYKR